MADQEQVERLKRGVVEWNMWRQECPQEHPNLIGADLSYADLSYADLRDADFARANLRGADLHHANLRNANLSSTYLVDTNIISANLKWTTFSRTLFAWMDLNQVQGLETARHHGPSSVDINSVILPVIYQDKSTVSQKMCQAAKRFQRMGFL
jgi:Pentapeptide repeats (8 copies)